MPISIKKNCIKSLLVLFALHAKGIELGVVYTLGFGSTQARTHGVYICSADIFHRWQ